MSSSTTDRLAKYRRPGQTPAAAPIAQPATNQTTYVAYQLSKEAKRHLEIRVKFPDPAECPLNAMITNVRAEWRMGMAITLEFGNTMMVKIQGKRLQELFQAIKDWKVEWIAEYDPQEHTASTDPDAPVIEMIQIITERPEPLPPLEQRH